MWNVNGNLLASIRVTSKNHVSINCCIMSEVCVCVCVRAWVRACGGACVRALMCVVVV